MQNIYKLAHIALISLFLVTAVATSLWAAENRSDDGPAYEVEARDGAYELRRYAPHLAAEVTVEGPRSRAANKGFRVLAGFIFGGNSDDQKIAMTSPVSQQPVGAKDGPARVVRFAMPSGLDLDDMPVPDDRAIRLVDLPALRQVSVTFSGRWTDANLAGREQALRDWASRNDLTVVGDPVLAFYDSPFTLPSTRRNEIALRVR